jgi:hypothetical protein
MGVCRLDLTGSGYSGDVSDFCENGSEHRFHNMRLISGVGEEMFAF